MTGCLVPPPPWTAALVGVFRNAVSLLHSDGALVSIVASADMMEARSFYNSTGFPEFRDGADAMPDGGEREKPPVIYDGRSLKLFSPTCRDFQESTPYAILDFSGSIAWDPRLSVPKQAPLTPGGIIASIDGIERALDRQRLQSRLSEGIHAPGAFANAFKKLEDSPGFPSNLVGFGPGTTPAGDDWLTGYLTALDLCGQSARTAADELRSRLRTMLDRTTAAGRALLLGAVAAVPPHYLLALAHAVSDAASSDSVASKAKLEDAVAAALRHGATSGEDALAGFLAGLYYASR